MDRADQPIAGVKGFRSVAKDGAPREWVRRYLYNPPPRRHPLQATQGLDRTGHPNRRGGCCGGLTLPLGTLGRARFLQQSFL